jgi:hypothetical protein
MGPQVEGIMRITALFIALVVLIGSACPASGTGTTAFNFLKVGLGARPVGMGGAFTAVADDATAVYWNPAGLTAMVGTEALAGYIAYMADINSGFAAYTRPMGDKGRLAVSINSFYIGDIVETDETGNELGTFGSSMFVPTLAYGRRLNEKLAVGAAAKLVYQSIASYTSYGAALDVGATYLLPDKPYSFGFVVQNLGQQLSAFVEETDLTPITAKAGAVYRHRTAPFVAALDVGTAIDSDIFFNLGAEYWVSSLLGLRFGYYSMGQELHSESDRDILGGLSFGLGLRWKKYGFDYALVPKVDLGQVHRLSLSVKM